MNRAITTTVVGSYTVPDWYPTLQAAVGAGELEPEAFIDAKAIAARAAVKDQEAAGIDVVSDGELFRRDDNRFGPPNAMINHFAAKIPGFSGELRDKSGITPVAPSAVMPAPVVVDDLQPVALGLVDELEFLRASTERPAKIAMTGPHMFASVAWDERYGSREELAFAMAEVVNAELRRLDEAGCNMIQLDEPILWFLTRDHDWGVAAINRCFAGVTHGLRMLHLCQGNYNPDPRARIGIRIFPAEFDAVQPLLEHAEVDVLHLAFASLGVDDLGPLHEFPRDKALAIGAVDVQSHGVETPDEVAAALERVVVAVDGVPVMAAPDCGLNHLPRDVAFAKLRALVRGSALAAGAAPAEPVLVRPA